MKMMKGTVNLTGEIWIWPDDLINCQDFGRSIAVQISTQWAVEARISASLDGKMWWPQAVIAIEPAKNELVHELLGCRIDIEPQLFVYRYYRLEIRGMAKDSRGVVSYYGVAI